MLKMGGKGKPLFLPKGIATGTWLARAPGLALQVYIPNAALPFTLIGGLQGTTYAIG